MRALSRVVGKMLPPYLPNGKVFNFFRYIYRLIPFGPRLRNYLRGLFLYRLNFFRAHFQDIKLSLNYKRHNVNADISDLFDREIKYHIEKKINFQQVKKVSLLCFEESDLERIAKQLNFQSFKNPVVTIVIPFYENLKITLECLASINRANTNIKFEILLADDASSLKTYNILASIIGVRLYKNSKNIGFLKNCNSVFPEARGMYTLILNNDVQVEDFWLDKLVEYLSINDSVGAVGPKIIYPSGRLQEAGCSLNFDGSSDMVGLNDDPEKACYSYSRPVDFCSGAALMVRTKLLRELGGFDERFAPAYCEDADLCLSLDSMGYKTHFVADVTITHHLSKTMANRDNVWKLQQTTKNTVNLFEKWSERIDQLSKTRKIAFYLPQYHEIPENNKWWGEGFTEWMNVKKAKPNFERHYQPHIPLDLGYYDLSDSEVMKKQINLAMKYGIDGFCYYYYWFAGKRLLEMPLENLFDEKSINFPFCLCWANENWTRRWDGRDNEVLINQKHSADDDEAVIRDLIRYFKLSNYIKIDGKPLLLVYRVELFPNFYATSIRWRDLCKSAGIGEIYIAMVESHDLVHANTDPKKFGCDASVEFPPLNMAVTAESYGKIINKKFVGGVADYFETSLAYCKRDLPAYKRFRGVMPGWDNTPRRQDNGCIFINNTPKIFQAWLEFVLDQTRKFMQGDERIVFINAWNEWAEGAHLEPDVQYGYSFLEAVRNAESAERLLIKNRDY